MEKYICKTLHIIIILAISVPAFSQNSKRYNKRGVEFGKQKRYDEAVKEFDKSIKIYNKNSAKTFHNKGWVYELKGNFPAAIAAYEEAIRRNPEQLLSLERVGYLYYTTGFYDKAVITGENVLKINPANEVVIKWLADAYAMRLKKKRDDLMAKKEQAKKKKEEKKVKTKKTKEEEKKKEQEKLPPIIVSASYEGMIRTAQYFKGDKGYKYESTEGAYGNFPQMTRINFTPNMLLELNAEFGNPYLGALSPNLIIHEERLEGIFHLGNYMLGIGGMGNHYKGSELFGENKAFNDYKIGFIFGAEKEDIEMKFALYPRALIADGVHSTKQTMDVDYMKFDYLYKMDTMFNIYSWISARDYYYFDHDIKMSHYFGVYEIGLGLRLTLYDEGSKRKFICVSLDFTERFYMLDLANDKPYDFGNGQGWFGVNKSKWFKGDPFSGYRAPGHVISIRVEEWPHKYIFLFQEISAEFVDKKEDHNEFCLLLGVGGVYF